jgi:hypothetical protein
MNDECPPNLREPLVTYARLMFSTECWPTSGGKPTFPTLSLSELSLTASLKGLQGGVTRTTQSNSGLGRRACPRWLTGIQVKVLTLANAPLLNQNLLEFVEQYSKRIFAGTLVLLVAVMSFACAASQERRSIPPEVESTIASINEEIAAERYDRIYEEASELWRQDNTLEESIASFKTLRAKLGLVESRVLQSATEQQNSGGPLKGRAYIVTYRTKFQNGEGMETFTLVERNGRWLLARYFVNSTALK